MESEKRAKRPRIGMSNREGATERYEKVEYRRNGGEEGHSSYSANAERPYYPRNNYGDGGNRSYGNERPNNYGNRQGGYSNNRQGNYGNNRRNNNYNNTPRYNQDYNRNNEVGEGFQQPYGESERPRYPKQNNRPGGYNNRGYNNRGGYNQNRQQPRRNNKVFSRPQRIEYELPEVDPNEPIRLNKFMANAGICSRREADEFIQAGEVLVNGVAVTELGTKITRNDTVTFRGKVVTLERKIYVLLNKPKDCVTTSDDPQGRLTVMDIVRNACTERIYPVGRLDRNTTGVFTADERWRPCIETDAPEVYQEKDIPCVARPRCERGGYATNRRWYRIGRRSYTARCRKLCQRDGYEPSGDRDSFGAESYRASYFRSLRVSCG